MKGRQKFAERRRHRRFRLRQPAFVVFDTDPSKLREIFDLGMSGLAVTSVDNRTDYLKRAHRLTIISRIRGNEPEEYLGGLPCRVVAERMVNELPPSQLERRRYGIELLDLSPGQRQKLARFIIANAQDEG